jgi:hypothetical protein
MGAHILKRPFFICEFKCVATDNATNKKHRYPCAFTRCKQKWTTSTSGTNATRVRFHIEGSASGVAKFTAATDSERTLAKTYATATPAIKSAVTTSERSLTSSPQSSQQRPSRVCRVRLGPLARPTCNSSQRRRRGRYSQLRKRR